MNLEEYAENELKVAGIDDEELYRGKLAEAVLELIKVFRDQGHSGYSASLTLQIFQRVANYKPLTPLTGEEDEWFGIEDSYPGGPKQNKRYFSVFKEGDRVWDGNTQKDITFPYVVE